MSEAHPDPCSKWKKGFNFYNSLVFDASYKGIITEKQIITYDFDYCPFCGAKLIPYPRERKKKEERYKLHKKIWDDKEKRYLSQREITYKLNELEKINSDEI